MNKNRVISGYLKKGTAISETIFVLVLICVIVLISFGIVAANYNKNQTIVRLRNVYMTLSYAFSTSVIQNGKSTSWDIEPDLSERGSYTFFQKYLKGYLPVARDCKNSTEEVCGFDFKELNGTDKSLNSNWTRFFLEDGSFIALQSNSGEKYKLVYIYVDINGKKHVNVVGRDIFIFVYWIKNEDNPELENHLLPFGNEYTMNELVQNTNENNCNPTKNGNYCSALIIKNEWQIPRKYPWVQARYGIE